jgi:hypothetical protein
MVQNMKSTNLAASFVATITLIAIIGTLAYSNSINAQMMRDGDNTGNTTSGSINLEQTTFEAVATKTNTSLIQAMTTAEKSVGNNSFALAAFGNDLDGFFVYHIILGTPNMEFYNVIFDPGKGEILATQETSKNELEKMHLEHSSEVVHGGHGSIGGFPLLIPH